MSEVESAALSDRYQRVRDRIVEACIRSGRVAGDVCLVAVSKTHSAETVRRLYELGHRDFGENKVQELTEKFDQLSGPGGCPDLRWHLIGHLQRNKVKSVVSKTRLFHALDSERLAAEIDKRVPDDAPPLNCLLQINISEEDSKYGIPHDRAEGAVEALGSFSGLRLCGLMAMARPDAPVAELRRDFTRMRLLRDRLVFSGGQGLLSIGMSQDFEVAIEEGATHVRVGSAIFGERG